MEIPKKRIADVKRQMNEARNKWEEYETLFNSLRNELWSLEKENYLSKIDKYIGKYYGVRGVCEDNICLYFKIKTHKIVKNNRVDLYGISIRRDNDKHYKINTNENIGDLSDFISRNNGDEELIEITKEEFDNVLKEINDAI